MAKSYKQWLEEDFSEAKDYDIPYLSSNHFFRDPIRPIKNNTSFIYSPADGFLIDTQLVNDTSDLIFTKTGETTLKSLTCNQIDNRAYWVVTIFLTFFDPHIIRCPYNGVLKRKDLPASYVTNRPMLDFEADLYQGIFRDYKKTIRSFCYNQRVLLSISPPQIINEYYLLLTADSDIDTVVTFFSKPHTYYNQNKRIASIRYGSMVNIILPATDVELKPLQPIGYHVEAGIDPLFSITH